MSVADKLLQLNQVKQDIKTAIETKGIPMTDVAFTEYANKILDISGGGGEVDEYFYYEKYYYYYAKYYYTTTNNSTLFSNAWEHSLTVDPSEISVNSSSSSSNQRGTAQYPNGETEGVIIPQGVTTIGEYAFYNWQSNNHPLVIPNSVTSIGRAAFQNWQSNTHPLVIPNSVTSIETYAFYYWISNNRPLVIPNSVTSIGSSAFMDWQSNNHPLVIPNSVTSIGRSAFRNWQSNNHPLIIPNSVTSIEAYAFTNWSLVPYIEIQAITPPSLSNINAFKGQNDAPIYVPNESVDDYKTATNWVDLADRIFPIQTFEWQAVGESSSEPYYHDLLIDALINGDYEQGLHYLNNNYPAGDYQEGFVAVVYDQSTYNYFEYVVVVPLEFECYLISQYDYNSKEHKLDVTVPEGFNEIDVMYAFKTQHLQYYETLSSVNYHMFGVRANNGYAYSYWAIRPK